MMHGFEEWILGSALIALAVMAICCLVNNLTK